MSLKYQKLWIIAIPLGNPGDLSPRAKTILEQVDIVLAEDTRRAGLICQQCGIKAKQFISLYDQNEETKIYSILSLLKEGKICALISDAGMPTISDPGYLLIRACKNASIPISVIPGPSAPITAIAGSAIAPQPFVFFGFLPRGEQEQKKLFTPFISLPYTIVFFERKDRLVKTLSVAYAILGSREVCIAREMTKTHEEYISLRLENTHSIKTMLGEITIVIGPPELQTKTEKSVVLMHIDKEIKTGGTQKDIAKRVQKHVLGWTTKKLYTLITERR